MRGSTRHRGPARHHHSSSTPVDPRSGDAVASLERYFAELDVRFPGGFDPDGALVADASAFTPRHGAFVVVRLDGSAIACGAVQRLDEATGAIKRMWVHADRRGDGVGRRLLEHLELRCRELGCARVVLDTNETLTEAISMYERAGYRPIERYHDNPHAQRWSAKDLGGTAD